MNNRDITPKNKQRQAHGYWELYWDNGKIMSKGNWNNGKQVGYWEHYWYSTNEIRIYI